MTNCIQVEAIDEQSDLSNMQILTGVEVNSDAYFPQFREYCPSAEDWSMMTVTICFVIPLIEMDTELEPIVNQLIKFKTHPIHPSK